MTSIKYKIKMKAMLKACPHTKKVVHKTLVKLKSLIF